MEAGKDWNRLCEEPERALGWNPKEREDKARDRVGRERSWVDKGRGRVGRWRS